MHDDPRGRASDDVEELAEQARAADAVFIVGGARSGSSLLYRTLQRHSAFRPRREHLAEAKVFDDLPWSFRWNESRPHPMIDYLRFDIDAWGEFLRLTRAWRRRAWFEQPVARPLHRQGEVAVWRHTVGPRLVRGYFGFAQKVRGGRRILEKTPGNIVHGRRLLHAFPSAKLLYISRHPLDTYTSYLRRARDDAEASWADISVDRFCEIYQRDARLVSANLQRGTGRFHVVRYEELTGHPHDALRSICGFLGEPVEHSALEEPAPDPTRHEPDPLLFAPITASSKDWRALVDDQEAHRLEERLRGAMEIFGYEPYL